MTKAPAFDVNALAAAVKESDPIERVRNVESKFANNPFVARLKETGEKTMETPPVPNVEAAKEVQSYLRDAAEKNGTGLSTSIVPRGKGFVVKYAAKAKRQTGGMTECPVCKEQVTVTQKGTIRVHGPQDDRCKGSGVDINPPAETPAE